MEGLRSAMAARDESDQTRTASPLQIAPDAIYVDTTALDMDQVFEKVKAIVAGAHAQKP